MFRQVSRSATVGFGRLTGYRKILDEPFTGSVFLLRYFQDFCRRFQLEWERKAGGVNHRASPRVGRKLNLEMPTKASPLKLRIPGGFDDAIVKNRVFNSTRNLFSTGQVDDFNRLIIKSVCEKKNVEITLDIAVKTTFC